MASPAPSVPPGTGPDAAPGGGAALLLGIALIGVVLAAAPSVFFDLDRHQVPKELMLHLAALGALWWLGPRRGEVRLGVAPLLLLATLGWTWASALLATNHWIAFRAVAVVTSGWLVFRLAAGLRSSRWVTPLLWTAVAAVGLAAGIGVAEAYGFAHPVFSSERVPGGTFGNRNFLAHFSAIGLPVVLVTTLRDGRVRALVPGGLVAVVAVALVVLTRSRAAWLAVAGSLAIMSLAALRAGAWWRSRPARLRLGLGGAVLAGAVAAFLLPNRLDWRSDSPYRDTMSALVDHRSGSGQGRLVQWRNSLELVRQHPVFGTGPGNWFVHYPTVTQPGDPAFAGYAPVPTNPWPSSDWIAFLTEAGLPGTALLLLAGLTLGLTAWRRLRSDTPGEPADGVMLLGVLTAALVCGAFDAVLHLAAPLLLVSTVVGVAQPETGTVLGLPPGSRPRRLGWGAALLITLLAVGQTAGNLHALVATRTARSRAAIETAARWAPGNHHLELRLAQTGPCRDRIPHARAAQALLPHHAFPRRILRDCGVRP